MEYFLCQALTFCVYSHPLVRGRIGSRTLEVTKRLVLNRYIKRHCTVQLEGLETNEKNELYIVNCQFLNGGCSMLESTFLCGMDLGGLEIERWFPDMQKSPSDTKML